MSALREDAREALYAIIIAEAEKLKQWESSNASAVERLARAYRAVYGGAQPGGGCDCTKK